MSITVSLADCRKYSIPGTPITLAISCGSQIAVVTPRGPTQRSNSCGVTSELSMCRCVSMKPGTRVSPVTSTTCAASYSAPMPTMVSPQIATSPGIFIPVTMSQTTPPRSTRSAGASPRPCAISLDRDWVISALLFAIGPVPSLA